MKENIQQYYTRKSTKIKYIKEQNKKKKDDGLEQSSDNTSDRRELINN